MLPCSEEPPMTSPKLTFTDSKPAVRWYVQRAKLIHGRSRCDIAKWMGVGPNFVSMLVSPRDKARIPLDKIEAFSDAVMLSPGEKFRLTNLRLKECDGQKTVVPYGLLRDLILAVRHAPPTATAVR